jgi:hypothetical protein
MEQVNELGEKLFRLSRDPNNDNSKFVDIYNEKIHIHSPEYSGLKKMIKKSYIDYVLPISSIRTIAFTPHDDTFLFFNSGQKIGIKHNEFDNNLHKVLNHITTAPGQLAVVNREAIEYFPEFSFSEVLKGEMLPSNMITISKKRKNKYEIYVGNQIIGDITHSSFDGERSPEEITFSGYKIDNKTVNKDKGRVIENVFCILNRHNYAVAHGTINESTSDQGISTTVSIADYNILLESSSKGFYTITDEDIDISIILPSDKDEVQITVKGISMTTNLAELLAYMSVSILEPEVFLDDLK